MRADVVLLTALAKELEAVLDPRHGISWTAIPSNLTSRTYYLASVGEQRVAAVRAGDVGQLHAAVVTADAMTDLEPAAILLVGIAAAISHEVELGDLVIANSIIDTEPGKITPDRTLVDLPQYSPSRGLLNRITAHRDTSWHAKIPVQRPRAPDGGREATPRIHEGPFLCANKVVASEDWLKPFTDQNRKLIALEMEAAGAAAMIQHRKDYPPHFAVIKCAVDRADLAKGDEWHEYGASTAATFALEFLKAESGTKTLRALRNPEQIREEEASRLINRLTLGEAPVDGVQRELVQNLSGRLVSEIQGALAMDYHVNVSMGDQFLLRAAPLFREATELYATSLDTVSTFWTDPANKAAALSYLEQQAPHGTAMRLFVFSGPDAAHKHAKVLDQHCERYRHVFVCSMDYYRTSIVPRIGLGPAAAELHKRDFAVLTYGCEDTGIRRIFAELDFASLRFHPLITDGAQQRISLQNLTELFQAWSRSRGGAFCKPDLVLRWQQNMWLNQEAWSEVLTKLFNSRQPDATHMVFFKVEPPNTETTLRGVLATVKKEILEQPGLDKPSIAELYGIKHVWIGRKLSLACVPDGMFGGLVSTTAAHVESFALIMRFNARAGLTSFYQDEAHSRIRKYVFEKLDARIPGLYEVAAASHPSQKSLVYEAIEAVAGRYVHRRDYLDDESIAEMVQTATPYDPRED